MTTQAVGAMAEEAAAAYLQQRGAQLVTRNYRCRYGEIDLIIQDDGVMAFVEVRCRQRWSAAADSIGSLKRNKIQLTAQHYLSIQGTHQYCRFDVVLVDAKGRVRWIKEAFRSDD